MKIIEIDGVGPVQLVKHANSRSLRISIGPNGTVKVTIPRWTPYQAGAAFALSKRLWIIENLQPTVLIRNGTPIGKFHHLYFRPNDKATGVSSRRKGSELIVSYPSALSQNDPTVQQSANKIAIKALREQAESLLPNRLRDLANKHGFEFKSVSVRQLKARWGSCNSKSEITLNLFLMQLSWELIDYVLLHELTHTKAMHHGPEFWEIFEAALPGAKKKRSALRAHKTQVITTD